MRLAFLLFLKISAGQYSNRFEYFIQLKQLKQMKELGIPLREIMIQNVISPGLPVMHSIIMNRKKIQKKRKELEARPKWSIVELEPETFSVAKTSFRGSQTEYNSNGVSLKLFGNREMTQNIR